MPECAISDLEKILEAKEEILSTIERQRMNLEVDSPQKIIDLQNYI